MTRIVYFLTFVLYLTSCSKHEDKTTKATQIDNSVDTSKSFKIDNSWTTPKETFKFNSLEKSFKDTLRLVTCSDYVFYPFGKLVDKSSLSSSLLKNFTVSNYKLDTFTNKNTEIPFLEKSENLDLSFSGNNLKLFLDNDPEASTHGYIKEGKIIDNKVLLLNDIKIGINTEEFYNKFFEQFPKTIYSKYKVVEFISCVEDIKHVYTFKNGKLYLIQFISE
jgi:hypothetical protein